MKAQKSTSIPASMKIANCAICTLAERMKDCKTCPFKIGLGFKAIKKVEKSIVYTSQLKIIVNK